VTSGRTAILAIAIVLGVVVGGVGVYLVTSKSPGKGTVSIHVKDCADDWAHVNVIFSEVKIHAANARNESTWRSIKLQTRTVGLAALSDLSELLSFGNVSAGKYTQMREVVIDAPGTMTNGTIVNFTVPSGELKTTHPFTVTADYTETLTLDFHLDRCMVQNGSG